MNILVIIILVFLFWGEPDVWDKAHSFVMDKLEVTDRDNIKK
jgi:hypothetical protein